MKGNSTRALRVVAGLVGLVTLGWILTGHAARPAGSRPAEMGVPTDWSHRHVIFSQPLNAEQAVRVAADPRYWQQWYRDNMVREAPQRTSAPSGGFALFQPSVGINAASLQNDWSKDLGTSGTVGAGNFPAKYAFSTTKAKCAPNPDFVVFPTGLLGSSTQASIVAFYNIYTGCAGVKVDWAYDTGGQIITSPVFSQDGTQLAFIQTVGVDDTFFTLLKWKFSGTQTVAHPGILTSAGTAAAYASCTTPCMFTIRLKGGDGFFSDDSNSSVFYDYTGDTAWVGDNHGWIHKYHPVFLGAPAEVRSGPWPVQVNPGNPAALASPSHDVSRGNLFVGDAGGFLYKVNTSTSPGQVIQSAQVDFGTGVDGGPIIDVTSQFVYVFASSDGTKACAGATPCAAVYQFPENFISGATGTKVVVGSAGPSLTPPPLFDGQFDSAYRNSVTASGSFYVCGNSGVAPTLYKIPVTAGVFGTPVTGPAVASASTGCSPITDVLNPNIAGGATEWVYVSTQNSGAGNSCASAGCLMNFKNRPWTAGTAFGAKVEVLDPHFQVQVVKTAGTSGAVAPAWNTTLGGTTNDGTVVWVNQGPHSASHASWAASTHFNVGTEIIDTNKNIQLVTTAGTTGAAHPNWPQGVGAPVPDNTVRWLNVGPLATVSVSESGGTSGMIMDSTVIGSDNVYFSTQGTQACSDGTGGCAVQVPQDVL